MALRRGSQGFGFDPRPIGPCCGSGRLMQFESLAKSNNAGYPHSESSANPDCRK